MYIYLIAAELLNVGVRIDGTEQLNFLQKKLKFLVNQPFTDEVPKRLRERILHRKCWRVLKSAVLETNNL